MRNNEFWEFAYERYQYEKSKKIHLDIQILIGLLFYIGLVIFVYNFLYERRTIILTGIFFTLIIGLIIIYYCIKSFFSFKYNLPKLTLDEFKERKEYYYKIIDLNNNNNLEREKDILKVKYLNLVLVVFWILVFIIK